MTQIIIDCINKKCNNKILLDRIDVKQKKRIEKLGFVYARYCTLCKGNTK